MGDINEAAEPYLKEFVRILKYCMLQIQKTHVFLIVSEIQTQKCHISDKFIFQTFTTICMYIIDFRHSISVWFLNSLDFSHCLKSEQKCPDFRHNTKMSEIRTKKFGFQTSTFETSVNQICPKARLLWGRFLSKMLFLNIYHTIWSRLVLIFRNLACLKTG